MFRYPEGGWRLKRIFEDFLTAALDISQEKATAASLYGP